MRLLTYDELRPEMAATSALTQLSAFGQPFLDRHVKIYRKGGWFAPYVAVFAVEGGEVIGQTYVLRYAYRFRDGVAPVGGVAAVATRPDRTGRGLARQILSEVHRLERDDDVEHVLLWTNRSWGAHRIYEHLGYRDVYHPTLALRRFDASPRPRGGLRVRRARASDVPAIEALHTRSTRGRLGFSARARGFLGTEVRAEGPSILRSIWVALRGRTVQGYAVLPENTGRVECGELVARSAAAERALFRQFEHLARRRWGLVDYSVAGDRRAALRRAGFTYLERAWFVLMAARSDGREESVRARSHALATDDRRWVGYLGDRF